MSMVVVVLGVSYNTRPSIRVVLPVVYLANPHSRTRVVEELDASEVFGFVVVLGVRSPGLVGGVLGA